MNWILKEGMPIDPDDEEYDGDEEFEEDKHEEDEDFDDGEFEEDEGGDNVDENEDFDEEPESE